MPKLNALNIIPNHSTNWMWRSRYLDPKFTNSSPALPLGLKARVYPKTHQCGPLNLNDSQFFSAELIIERTRKLHENHELNRVLSFGFPHGPSYTFASCLVSVRSTGPVHNVWGIFLLLLSKIHNYHPQISVEESIENMTLFWFTLESMYQFLFNHTEYHLTGLASPFEN